MKDLSKTAAIVGVAESDEIGKTPHKSALQHHASGLDHDRQRNHGARNSEGY